MFCDFEELKPMKLELGEGSSSITGRGTVELTVKVKYVVNIIALQSVYYVKGFKHGRESHYNPSVESSDDGDDDSSPNQPQPLTPRKPVPVSTTPLKPTSSKGFNRAPIPNKPGWERVEVQRQSGATKGKWDIYFYAPGCKIPLRSRPELRDYCEQALKIPYNPDEFNWKPSEPLVDTVSQVDTDGDDVAQTKVQETDIDADSDPECYTVRVYLAEVVKEPSTFEEAMASPEKLLGVEFERDDNKLMLHQTQFIDQLASKYAVVANKLIKVLFEALFTSTTVRKDQGGPQNVPRRQK
uniref:MBD domain-containing protein n=1 Tax=Strigamia maritima TaxID=126957 RepID=T1IZ48_STRMM